MVCDAWGAHAIAPLRPTFSSLSSGSGSATDLIIAAHQGRLHFQFPSVLDMLTWLENSEQVEAVNGNPGDESAQSPTGDKIADKLKFETAVGDPVSLLGGEIAEVRKKLDDEFKSYLTALNNTSAGR